MNINESELLIAIEKSIINSEELISDADLLYQNNRLPRAYALYQLAMEEAGKAMDIFGNIVLGLIDNKGPKKLNKDFKDHVAKAQMARMLSLFLIANSEIADKTIKEKLLNWTLSEIEDSSTLNDYKNYSLYTSFIDNTYKLPNEIITKERLNYIQLMARSRVSNAKSFLLLSLKNLDSIKEYSKNNPINEEQINNSIKEFVEKNFSK